MKLSEFIKLSMNDMNEYIKNHVNTSRYYAKTKSIQYPAYTEEHETGGWFREPKKTVTDTITYYDIWTDGSTFGIEQDDCGWEIVPTVGAIITEHSLPEYGRNAHPGEKDAKLLIRKKSDNGLILFAAISIDKSWGSKDMDFCICGGINDGYFKKNGANYPIVLIDKIDTSKAYCNLPLIPLAQRDSFSHDESYKKRQQELAIETCNAYPFSGIGEYVYYPEVPSIRSYKTSKFNLFEYGEAAEQFAKNVQDNINLYDKSFAKDNNKNAIYSYRNFMSYKYKFPDMVWDDFLNLKKLLKNDTEIVNAFLKKCKTKRPKEYELTIYNSSCSSIFNFAWEVSSLDFMLFNEIFKRLDEYRKLVSNETDYKKELEDAKAEYAKLYNEQAQLCGAELNNLYDIIANTLDNATNVYGSAVDDINTNITKKYKNVKKDIVLQNINMSSIKDTILKCLEDELKKLGCERSSESTKKHVVDNDKAVLKVAKKIFDATPNSNEGIILQNVYKCEDAPYDVHERDGFEDSLLYVELEDSVGGLAAEELCKELYKHFNHIDYDGNDLYPGQEWRYVITRKMKFEEIELD